MNFTKEKSIFKKLNKKGFTPMHVAEVGVYYPETSNIYDYIQSGITATIVEPDPESIRRIKEHFSGFSNINLYEVAVYKQSGKISLAQRDASTFISELDSSPAIINDEYEVKDVDIFEVDAKRFDEIDDGTIDLLSIDIEGGEWYVLKYMVSRPSVISIETHGAIYINPHIDEIIQWMQENDYQLWYKDRSDSVYVKKGSINLTFIDKLNLFLYKIYLILRRNRKILKKSIREKFGKN